MKDDLGRLPSLAVTHTCVAALGVLAESRPSRNAGTITDLIALPLPYH